MSTTTLRETPLASAHRKLNARMVDFAGWNMPVQYKSIVTEHMATREKVGLFDVSHMGEFLVTGERAADFVQYVIANDVNRLTVPDRALYSQLCYEDGGTVDDLIVYRRKDNFMLVVNASNIDKDFAWLKSHASQFGVSLTNLSDDLGLLALQGPQAVPLLAELAGGFVADLPSFGYGEAIIDGVKISFGRTGYTGEDGFEIFVDAAKVEWLWNTLLEKGASRGIEPCGLGARDTLRLEAGLPLYGHELEKDISPIESGLGWSVKPDKGNFIGRDVLAKQKAGEISRQIVCLKSEGKALPRQGYAVFSGDKEVGAVTSGSQGIFVGYPIAFAMVSKELTKVGTELSIAIRDTKVPAKVVTRPWYKRKK
ncbi:MAG: glycine cleavage system aminomethyltransferase GcvT [Candidatus Melainabacteria bacterium]|nr:glycine cleavage system aminomethyltransferase GcvT [Candidatus Melainabacteria bacterium]